MPIRVRDNNRIPELIKQAKKLNGMTLEVGISDQGEIGMIAAVHEFGATIRVTDKMRGYFRAIGHPLKATTTVIRIPERSFIRAGFDANIKAFMDFAKTIIQDAFESGIAPEVIMDALGTMLRGKLQEYMRDLKEPPLSDFTVERTGRSNPLVHSGHLLRAIEFEVK